MNQKLDYDMDLGDIKVIMAEQGKLRAMFLILEQYLSGQGKSFVRDELGGHCMIKEDGEYYKFGVICIEATLFYQAKTDELEDEEVIDFEEAVEYCEMKAAEMQKSDSEKYNPPTTKRKIHKK